MTRPPRALTALAAALLAVGVTLAASGCTRQPTTPPANVQAASTEAFITTQVRESNNDYAYYVKRQSEQLMGGTAEFAAAYSTGDDELARSMYAPTRMFYNRLLAVSDSFSDLAQSLDERPVDADPGTTVTGWHAIEEDLFPSPGHVALTTDQRSVLASNLISDTDELADRIDALRPSVDQQTQGAATLLSTLGMNAAAGTQDAASGTDLSDLQGYFDGTRIVFNGIRPILVTQDAALATTLDHQFDALQNSLNAQRVGVSFTSYSDVDADDLANLKQQVADLAASFERITPTLGQ